MLQGSDSSLDPLLLLCLHVCVCVAVVLITIQITYDVLSISIDNPTSALFQVDGILSVVAMQFRGCSFPLLLLSVPPAPSDHSFGPRVIPSPPRLEQRGLLELA